MLQTTTNSRPSEDARHVLDLFRQLARESNPSTQEPVVPPDYQEDPSEYEDPPAYSPIDPPDNDSLPGDPSVTRPDY